MRAGPVTPNSITVRKRKAPVPGSGADQPSPTLIDSLKAKNNSITISEVRSIYSPPAAKKPTPVSHSKLGGVCSVSWQGHPLNVPFSRVFRFNRRSDWAAGLPLRLGSQRPQPSSSHVIFGSTSQRGQFVDRNSSSFISQKTSSRWSKLNEANAGSTEHTSDNDFSNSQSIGKSLATNQLIICRKNSVVVCLFGLQTNRLALI